MGLEKLNKLLSYMAYRIFRPLVILFLRNSIPYQTASDWLKRVYIDTAFDNKEFRINSEKKQTKTRVAVLTGLSRVEIDRVLKIEQPLEVTEQNWNRATKVLSGWCGDVNYVDDQQKPKELPIYGAVSFSSLVEKYSGGATMRSVLDELENVKSVELVNNKVRLVRQDYSPMPEKQHLLNLELYGTSTGDLLNTLVFNDSEKNKEHKRLQKLVFHRSVPEAYKQEIIRYINQNTNELLIKIDNKMSSLCDVSTSQQTSKLGLGAYYFEENNHVSK